MTTLAWLLIIIVFVAFYLVTELVLRRLLPRYIVVKVKSKDGTIRSLKINAGRDPEYDELISRLKKAKAAPH